MAWLHILHGDGTGMRARIRDPPEAGLGFVACIDGNSEAAWRRFQRARSLDPKGLAPFQRAYEQNAAVREFFAGVQLQFTAEGLTR